jgi:mono/diheme cytochrome c family protein
MCHGPAGPGKQFYQADLPLDGPVLYDLACAACHKDLASSKVSGESAKDIQKKIDENEGGMGPLRVLSTQEIEAIAAALTESGGDD